MGIFLVYQALPASWVPDRNDELIFEQIGYNFIINIILNQLWIVVHSFSTGPTWILAWIIIASMLANTLFMMMKSTRAEVNVVEWISIRFGFSIYAGWLTVANILSITSLL